MREYLNTLIEDGNTEWISETTWSSDTDFFNSSLGMDVYTKRKAEGLTQRELAQILGIAMNTLSKIESGHENISQKIKLKLEEYLNDETY
ncbi:helix-turn-helix transcriptional regulator [Schinkia azotoformans]|uniref:helix-turn-helix domain-containing protein n=1 Tax=Schinkia azotoformans TaxID=1454 RepID=UPI002E247FC2|nr:helix-turn-helix transcriptional regulator [Schinkia azotoformans]